MCYEIILLLYLHYYSSYQGININEDVITQLGHLYVERNITSSSSSFIGEAFESAAASFVSSLNTKH